MSSLSSRRTVLLKLALAVPGMLTLLAAQDSKPKEKDEKDKDSKAAASPVVYTPGGEVKAPKVLHYVEPAFSSSSKEAFVEGVVKIKTVVTPDGLPSEIQVTRGLNAEEDRTAVEAVKQWRFQPGTKDGQAVHVRVSIEIAFHLM